jgi:hypothetical protein
MRQTHKTATVKRLVDACCMKYPKEGSGQNRCHVMLGMNTTLSATLIRQLYPQGGRVFTDNTLPVHSTPVRVGVLTLSEAPSVVGEWE